MGVGLSIIEFFNTAVLRTFGSIDHKRMVELGDQKIWDSIVFPGQRVWFKEWVEDQGCHHYSIDIHGMNGSHPLDLSLPIRDAFWHGRFDIVTNFGTSEYVSDQFQCFQNLHYFGKPGSLYVHVLPEKDKYRPDHCNYWYDAQFFLNLIERQKYTMVIARSLPDIGHVACAYLKPRGSVFQLEKAELMSWIRTAQ